MTESGGTNLYLVVSNSSLNCTVKLDTERIHGPLVLHPVFFTLAFSPDGRYVVYLAEREHKHKHETEHWRPYAANKGGLFLGTKYKVWRPK